MKKSCVLLYLCDDLKNGKKIHIESCCMEYDISVPTFRRYVAMLRNFFWEKYRRAIVYVSAEKAYALAEENGSV